MTPNKFQSVSDETDYWNDKSYDAAVDLMFKKRELDMDHIEGDVNTFQDGEGDIPESFQSEGL